MYQTILHYLHHSIQYCDVKFFTNKNILAMYHTFCQIFLQNKSKLKIISGIKSKHFTYMSNNILR